jgi:alkylhydroperoxidase family enzyme
MMRIAPATPIDPAQLAELSDFDQVSVIGRSVWAHRPEVAKAMDTFRSAMADSGTLSPRLRELVRIRIAFHNQCRSCMAVRYQPDVVDEALVCELERPEEASDLTPAERAALRFADLFATEHLAIDEAVFDSLREHFQEGELVELSLLCAQCVGFGRMMATWHNVEALPESFREPEGASVTPWGHERVLVKEQAAQRR